jgi:hypothetical protein
MFLKEELRNTPISDIIIKAHCNEILSHKEWVTGHMINEGTLRRFEDSMGLAENRELFLWGIKQVGESERASRAATVQDISNWKDEKGSLKSQTGTESSIGPSSDTSV